MPPPRAASALPTKQAILDYLAEADSKTTRRDIARAFNIKGAERAELRQLLSDMADEGLLEKEANKRHRAPGDLPPVLPVDVMSVDDDGDLLCMPASWRGDAEPPMIRLSRREAEKTKPTPGVGDRLLARLTKEGDNGYSVRIIKPIGKSAHRFLAVFRKTRFGGVADPVERRARNKLTIDKEETRGAEDGDLVWCETVNRRGASATRARVREIAGHINDRNSFSLIALANHGIPVALPEAVLQAAEKAETPSLGEREDLRTLPLLTIDPSDAKDHDDAVWAAPDDAADNDGGFKIIVAIADVSWFVRPGGVLDKEARRRGNSVYLPDRVVPMLPEKLSNNLCSLREGEDRPCLAVEMTLNKDGQKIRHKFMRGMMRSAARLSYEDAQKRMTAPQTEGVVDETLNHLYTAFKTRWTERQKRAPLDLDLPERRIVLGDDGNVARIERRERFDAHRLIEEFMILANIAAAETLEEKRTPQIYRVHDAPDPERLDATRDYLATLDYSLVKGGSVRPRHFNQLLKLAGEREQKEMVSEVVLRSQRQAVYATENLGHFGLNLARYSHFTSPIRRYADLIVHRALVKACKLGAGGQTASEAEDLDDTAELISDLERRAMAAERESTDRYLAGFLEEKVGDEFDGRIRGVTRFGVFVALDESGADGFVPMRALGFERFRFDEAAHAVIGETSGGRYYLGQPVSVRLAEAAPLTGGLRFEMLSNPAAGEKKTRRGNKPSNGKASDKKAGTKPKGRLAKSKAKKAAKKTARAEKTKKKKKTRSNAKSRQSSLG
ncbi:MAG: ribonuclease R [Pseudomonadota bacterium]